MLYRRTGWFFLPRTFFTTSIVAVLAAIPFMLMREPWDVRGGQSQVKTVFDYASWFLMIGTPWLLYRIVKWAVDDPWIIRRLGIKR